MAGSLHVESSKPCMFFRRWMMNSFWDGHTDYRVKLTDEEERENLEKFAEDIEKED